MVSSNQVDSKQFDVSFISQREYHSVRVFRYILMVTLGALLITIILSTANDIVRESDPTVRWLTTAVVILLGAVAVFVYWGAFYFTSPGAELIELDSEGVTLVYQHAKRLSMPWRDRRIKMRLILFTRGAVGFDGAAATEVATLLWGAARKFNRVTPEVVYAVVAAAEQNGLFVGRRSYASGGGNRMEFVISAARFAPP